jgi:hypothetical protein
MNAAGLATLKNGMSDRQFEKEMLALLQQFEDLSAREGAEKAARTVFAQLLDVLRRASERSWERVFRQAAEAAEKLNLPGVQQRRGPGRPRRLFRSTVNPVLKRSTCGRGRPRCYDVAAIVELVQARRVTAATENRRLSKRAALAELLAEVLETRDPKAYRRIEELRRYHQRKGYQKTRALTAAVAGVIGAHFQVLQSLVSRGTKTASHSK